MKKILSGIIVAIVVMLVIATTNVNAANVTANKTEINKGEQVVVSVNLNEETKNIDVKLNYDASKFEYVDGSATSSLGALTVNAKNEGKIIVSGSNALESTKQVSFTFVAKENTNGAEFTASGLVTEKDEELTGSNVTVKVVEKIAEEPKQEEPKQEEPKQEEPKQEGPKQEQPKQEEAKQEETKQEQPTTVEKTSIKGEKVDSNGKTITSLPKTGITYFEIAGIIAGVAIVVIAIKKFVK